MTGTKFQTISNVLNPKFETKSFLHLEIGDWDLFGICHLGFGISEPFASGSAEC
jgi:hypothetical protein